MPETFRTRLYRWVFNVYPAYRGTGARVTYIAGDWTEVRIRLPLNWRTRNRVKTIFGGSMYGAIDPVYMQMLMHLLGPDYVVWDKAASIRFRRPGREELYATFRLSLDHVAEIRQFKINLRHSNLCSLYVGSPFASLEDWDACCEKNIGVRVIVTI